ncbi:MAG: hypothetical protein NTZ67_04570 [Gammaproteobacteria bacterium]|nr:hypothetical protein [Gammaproteobacteria bacterium]
MQPTLVTIEKQSLLEVNPRLIAHDKFPVTHSKNWVTYPDMHGNALLMIFRLIVDGLAENSDTAEKALVSVTTINPKNSQPIIKKETLAKTQYTKLKELYFDHLNKLTLLRDAGTNAKKENALNELRNNVARFKKALSELKIKNDQALSVRFIGDILADRGAQDYFTLLVLEHLRNNNIQYEILYSNHDASFLDAYENILLACLKKSTRYLDNNQSLSLENLSILINQKIIEENEIERLTENTVKPNLKLISYDVFRNQNNEENIVFYTHAPVDFEAIKHMAIFLGIEYRNENIENFCHTVDQINFQFSLKLALGELKDILDADKNSLGELDEKLARTKTDVTEANKIRSKPPHLNANIITQSTPFNTFAWSRIRSVIETDNNPPRDEEKREQYRWPKNGWQAKAKNIHGHTGPNSRSILKLGETQSPYHQNTDTSFFGRPDNTGVVGDIIQHYSQNNRRPGKIAFNDNDIAKIKAYLEKHENISQVAYDFLCDNGFSEFSNVCFKDIKLNQTHFDLLINGEHIKFNAEHIKFSSLTGIKLTQIQFDTLYANNHREFPDLSDIELNQEKFIALTEGNTKNFSGVDLSKLTIPETHIKNLIGVKLTQEQFESLLKSNFKNFSSFDLSGLDFSEKNLSGCNFSNATLNYITINDKTNISNCQFKNVKCNNIVTRSNETELTTSPEQFIKEYEKQYKTLREKYFFTLFARSNYIESDNYRKIKTSSEKLLTILSHSKDKPDWIADPKNRTGSAVTAVFTGFKNNLDNMNKISMIRTYDPSILSPSPTPKNNPVVAGDQTTLTPTLSPGFSRDLK